MKRQFTNLFLAFGFLCVGAIGLQAQSYTLAADIPFAFHANGGNLPSGKYVFQKEVNRDVQSLRNRQTGRSLFLGVAPQSKVNHASPRLVFHRYGSEYFLSEIWNDQGTGTHFAASKLEAELRERKAEAKAETATVYFASAR
jgi:hypothetical protein